MAMLGSQGARLGARLLDIVFQLVAMIVMFVVVGLLQAALPRDAAWLPPLLIGIPALIAVLLYEPFTNWKYGGTFGKQICGLRVAQLETGAPLTFGRSLGRWAIVFPMGFVPLLGLLNVLWCCWDEPYRQCLHDKVAGTVVVRRRAQ